MSKITITEALVELKTLGKRIETGRNNLLAPVVQPGAVSFPTGQDEDSYTAMAKARLQSLEDLMKRRVMIKSAIASSNATTQVNIAGEVMTVQDAILRKNNNEDATALISTLVRAAANKMNAITTLTQQADDVADKLLTQRAGSSAEKLDSTLAEATRAARMPAVVDPYGDVAQLVATLSETNLAFMSSVDVQLTISNSTTFIEV